MANKTEVLQAIADEKAQVTAKLDAQNASINDLNNQIQVLKDQIGAGSPVTAEDLDEIVNAVHDIFVPAS